MSLWRLIHFFATYGSQRSNNVVGGDGNDFLSGSAGDDALCGYQGDDTIFGGEGQDILTGNTGNDILDGGAGDDQLWGGPDDDILRALEGADKLNGGPGQDTLEVGPDADTFILCDLDALDLIADYSFADEDVVDVTALVSAHLNGSGSDPTTSLGEYVQLVEQGDGAVDQLQVDVNGGADSFTTVATLNGDAGVRAVFDDDGVGAAGVAGVFVSVLWFGMDFQDAAGEEGEALSQRIRCCSKGQGQ